MRAWTLLVSMMAAVVAGSAQLSAAELEEFAGHWVRVEHERDDAARDAEIERVTASMSFLFRGAARAIMRRSMRPAEGFVIARDREVWSIRSDRGEEWTIGGDVQTGDADEEVTSRFEDGEIRQTWRHGESSHGGTVWRLGESDGLLSVTDTVEDANLDGAPVYSTTYRRAAD